MTEIKKLTKISLIVLIVVYFLFGILLVFLLEAFVGTLTGWTNPLSPRNFGGILLLGAVLAIFLLRKKEWEEIKIPFAFLFSFFIATIPIELIVIIVYSSTLSAAAIGQSILNEVIMCSLFTLGIVSYVKQRS
jgi:hypothetical protein